ncbi:hypothetical protein CC1G_06238 [Coprinopsis cinerea okayama7|uniref:BRCT domain-containing protein n=1 Tax=Coprinopsis cinerea (strain Okayama-7 / 130 / ATCC MYA-4618 / FGSC 9003) TaxID=240176 RepID=A8NVC1_COPC7|nr:hypothetical protein CC1G_06238 [Coprinopsis cinerea okayama7\|eukprot:XP_001836651.2 hypothetical protein CC1G_06238 [Coprinopsis cinerea okayama7\
MRVAEKFNARREANIRLVWEEWFWDSLEHGGRFDEEAYLVQNPRPERRPAESLPSQVPESEPSRANSLQAEPQPPQRQPTMDLDDLEDEAASVNVVPAVRLQVWGGLLERRGYEVTDGEIVRSPTKSQPAAGPQQAKSNALPSINYRKAGGVIDAVRSTNSFAPAEPEAGPSTSQRPLPFKRHSTANSGPSRAGTPAIQPSRQPSRRSSGQAPGAVQEDVNAAGPSSPKPTSSPPMPQIFAGMRLCVLGEAKAATVKSAIEASGGVYVQEEDENVDFIIVRLFSGSKIYQSEPDPKMREKYRTECWLESCIHDERICHPDEHVSFLPLAINTPVPGAEKIQIGLSGLDQSQSCHTRRLLRALGINIIPLFTRKATHLLCPSGTGAKFEKAGEWGIPVVSYSWLQAIASSGTIPPADDYLVTGPPSAADKANDHSIDIKGKGKAVANDDVRMQDITNNIHESPLAQHAALPAEKPAPPLSKNNSLERQPTAIVPPHGSGGSVASGLGQPTELLGGPALSSFFAPSRSSAAPSQESPLVRYGTRPSSSVAHTIGDDLSVRDDDDLAPAMDQEPQRTQPSHPDGTPQRKSTLSIMSNNDDRDMMRIPSSKSPSPMKLPLRRHASKSPVKLDPGQTKLLHESIQSLLGKRGPPDAAAEQGGDEDPDSLQTVDSARNSKRKKGQRAKPPARPKAQRSRTTTTASRRSPPEPSPAPVDGISLGAFNYGVEEESQRLDEQQQSVRVVYEDPAQLEERQRLMNMLKANSQVEGSLPSSGSLGKTRRSARLSSGL